MKIFYFRKNAIIWGIILLIIIIALFVALRLANAGNGAEKSTMIIADLFF